MDGQNRVKMFQAWALCSPVLSRTLPKPRPGTDDSTRRAPANLVLWCAALIRSRKPYPFPILSFFLELGLS